MGMFGRHLDEKGKLKVRAGTDIDTGPSLTKQAFADEVDINKIVAQFEKTGMVTHLQTAQPFYGDVSDIKDYQSALNVVLEANQLFMSMDARIRERFGNDPAKMVAFLDDPRNLEEAIKLGMVVKKPEAPVGDSAGSKPADDTKPS